MAKGHSSSTQLSFLAAIDTTPLLDYIITPKSPDYQQFIKDWANAPFFVLDLETMNTKIGSGLDPWEGAIRLYQIGLQDGRVLIYDAMHDSCKVFLRVLKQTCENPANILVAHNAYFDLGFLKSAHSINAQGVRCTRIMATIRWCGLNKYYRFSLAAVYNRLTGNEMSKEQQTSNWNDPNLSNTQLNYAAMDIKNTFTVFLKLCKEISSFDAMPDLNGNPCKYKLSEIAKIECDSIPAFVSMSFNGMPVCMDSIDAAIAKYKRAMEGLYQPVEENIRLPYSASSAKLAAAIYEHYDIWLVAEDKDDKDDYKVTIKQLNFLLKDLPEIPPQHKLTTSSDVLFQYYMETREEDLLRVSLTRSLKKHLDTLESLKASALRNGGVARTRYTSLGSTGTGRSTSGGDRISTSELLNLQNLPNHIEHPLLEEYELPPIRSVLKAPEGHKLSINDYSGSHLNIAIMLSQDPKLQSTKQLDDPHALFTSEVCKALGFGDKYTVEYCQENKKNDPLVASTRKESKTCFFGSFNGAGYKIIHAGFTKKFSEISLERCKLLRETFSGLFATYTTWQRSVNKAASKNIIEIEVKLKAGNRFQQQYGIWRSPDGRLMHSIAFENEHYNPKKKYSQEYQTKLPDITSAHLLSAESLALKQTLAKCNNYLNQTHGGDSVKLINTIHDEIVFIIEESEEGKQHLKRCLQYFAEDFNYAVASEIMETSNPDVDSTLCIGYNEK